MVDGVGRLFGAPPASKAEGAGEEGKEEAGSRPTTPPTPTKATSRPGTGKTDKGKAAAAAAAELEAKNPFNMGFLNKLESMLNTADGLSVTDPVLAGWLAGYLRHQ